MACPGRNRDCAPVPCSASPYLSPNSMRSSAGPSSPPECHHLYRKLGHSPRDVGNAIARPWLAAVLGEAVFVSSYASSNGRARCRSRLPTSGCLHLALLHHRSLRLYPARAAGGWRGRSDLPDWVILGHSDEAEHFRPQLARVRLAMEAPKPAQHGRWPARRFPFARFPTNGFR
jgi:hypothetical protein